MVICFSEKVASPGFPSKLASLLKPKLNTDRNASPSLRVPSRGETSRSPSPSHRPLSRTAAMLFKNRSHDMPAENADVSQNSSQLSGPDKVAESNNLDQNNNPEKVSPSPVAKLMGLFKKKPDGNDNKSCLADKQNNNAGKAFDSVEESSKPPTPANKMANLLKAQIPQDNSTLQDAGRASANQTPVNQNKPASPLLKSKVSPKLAAILKPRYKPSLGEAASLGQFLELKMRGGKNRMLSSAANKLSPPFSVITSQSCNLSTMNLCSFQV